MVLTESTVAASTPSSRGLSPSSLNAETSSVENVRVGGLPAALGTGRSGRQGAAWKRKGTQGQTASSVVSGESPGTRNVLDIMDEHFTGSATV